MKILSVVGEALIESFEQLRLVAYLDGKGIPTIGWGHTAGVHLGMTCTREQADQWLVEDTQTATNGVNASLEVECNQNQFDALVSFTYNVGVSAEAHSTMIKFMNAGNVAGAAAEFPKWDHENGVESAGLKRRRLAEQTLFLS